MEALGTAKANESVVITPTLEECLVDIFFEDGDAVRKDQVLVKLDDSEARHLLAEVSATLREQQKQFQRISKAAGSFADKQLRKADDTLSGFSDSYLNHAVDIEHWDALFNNYWYINS